MTANALTVLAPIKPGKEEDLDFIFTRIGDDIEGRHARGSARPHIDFTRSPRTHFARLVILPHRDAGADRHRLLFAAIHDGNLNEYLEEIAAVTSQMDEIWGACEGYRGSDRFVDFVHAHSVGVDAFYRAFRNRSAKEIREETERRNHLLDRSQPVRDARNGSSHRENLLSRFPRFILDLLKALLRLGLVNVLLAAREISVSLGRLGAAVRWFNRLTLNRMPPLTTNHSQMSLERCRGCSPAAPDDEVVDLERQQRLQVRREDSVAQNQLTLVTVNEPSRVKRLRAVMALIDLYSRHLAPPGGLAGISTIHFVRWAVIDGGKRLIMISDYDGTWEAYIEEFAEMILSGLDAIWRGSRGLPENGARDVAAFKQFLRCRQYQAQVFYSGYPSETVLKIKESPR